MSTLIHTFYVTARSNALNPPSNDILRKHGIIPPKPEEPTELSSPLSLKLRNKLAKLTPSQLAEAADDAFDDETERPNQQRKLEHARFVRVYPISREDYTQEVTEASNVDAPDTEGEGKGTGVVCFLYKDGYANLLVSLSHLTFLHSTLCAT